MIMWLFSVLLRTFVHSWSTVIRPILESGKHSLITTIFGRRSTTLRSVYVIANPSVRLSVCNIRSLWAQGLTFPRCFCIMLFFWAQATLCSKTWERSLKAKQSEAKQILDAGKQYWKMNASLCTTACILPVILSIVPRTLLYNDDILLVLRCLEGDSMVL